MALMGQIHQLVQQAIHAEDKSMSVGGYGKQP
jgi:hypothetical protein